MTLLLIVTATARLVYMSQRAVAEPAAFERANYMKILNSFDPFLP